MGMTGAAPTLTINLAVQELLTRRGIVDVLEEYDAD